MYRVFPVKRVSLFKTYNVMRTFKDAIQLRDETELIEEMECMVKLMEMPVFAFMYICFFTEYVTLQTILAEVQWDSRVFEVI